MARLDLMDRLEAVLPRVTHADEAGQILGVMTRICRAATAAVFYEQAGVLRWLAGDRLSDDVFRAIKSAWQVQRDRVLTGTAFMERGAPEVRSWLMWMRRPENGALDLVYLAGPELRPLDSCSGRLQRLADLLSRWH